ncbi:LysE family transporter [Streptomyces sp. NPDC057686]|uniref:LysE family transporter n=1 Tax=Streptomyces sp. NPDC057686 TaxID=3346212 RepID=UPI0036C2D61E
MSEFLSPALSGAVAGLGVAMPMGAMSVLLLQEAMRSRRTAMAAAAGIAVVDLGYAALATALGPWVASHVTPVEAWIRLASAAILLAIAAHGLRNSAASTPSPLGAQDPRHAPTPPPLGAQDPRHAPAAPPLGAQDPGRSPRPSAPPALRAPGPGTGVESRAGGGAVTAFGRFVALTAVNPTTALYFAALTTAQAATLTTPSTAAVFLAGVAAASLLWQQTLVALGAFAGRKVSPAARAWTFRLGYGLVAAYALKIALPLPHLT